MKTADYRRLVEGLLPAVLAAGRIEMRHFAAGVAVETKADTTPVTAADHEAEAVLLEGLQQVAPGVPVIAEEAVAAGRMPEIDDDFFLVDPLDGTRAFIKRSPEFTINIGLVEGNAPVFGIIYAPALDLLFATLGPDEAVETRLAPDAEGVRLEDCPLTRLHARDARPQGARRLRQPLARRPEHGGVLGAVADRGDAQGELLAQVLPDRQGRGRPLCAPRPDERMGHGGGARDPRRRRRQRDHPRRPIRSLYGKRARRIRQPAFRGVGRGAACFEPMRRRQALRPKCRNRATLNRRSATLS